MTHNMTGAEYDAMIKRHADYQREGMVIALAVVALTSGAVGAIFGWLARGWIG